MMTRNFLVCGPHGAGKSSLIAALADSYFPEETYVDDPYYDPSVRTRAEYGRSVISDNLEYVFLSAGTPRRFDFLLEIYGDDSSGYLFIVDSTRPETFLELRYAMAFLLNYRLRPYILAANKHDRPGAFEAEAIRTAFQLDAQAAVIPCIAISKPSVQSTFDSLLRLM